MEKNKDNTWEIAQMTATQFTILDTSFPPLTPQVQVAFITLSSSNSAASNW